MLSARDLAETTWWERRGPLLLLITLVLAYAAALWATPVRDVDEAVYAEIAREMLQRHSWIEPRLNEGAWYQHPPLVMWLQAASMAVFGVSAAARLPSLLAVLAVAAVLMWWQRRRGQPVDWTLAALWLSLPATHLMVRDAKLDAVLTLCMASAVLAARQRRLWLRLLLVCLAVAAGVLTKNAVAALWPGAVVVAAWLLHRRVARDDERRPAPVAALLAMLAGCALAVPWFVEMHHRYGPHFVETILGRQLLSRFAGEVLTDPSGPLFFVGVLAWSAAPVAVLALWRMGSDLVLLWKRQGQALDRGAVLQLSAALVPLVAMSLSRSKLPHYIFGLLPFVVLAAARELRHDDEDGAGRWPRIRRAVLALTPTGALLFAGIHAAISFDPTPAGWIVLAGLLSLAAAGLWVLRRGLGARSTLWPALLALCLVNLYFSLSADQRRRAYEPALAVAELLQTREPSATQPVFAYRFNMRSAIAFAARRAVQEVDDGGLRRRLTEQPGPRWILVLDDELEHLRQPDLELVEVARWPWHRTSRPSTDFVLRWRRAVAVRQLVLARVQLAPTAHPGDDGPHS
ncbi:MAG: glycosyltransferase family 39 protein [Pseudomonadota bacterium]